MNKRIIVILVVLIVGVVFASYLYNYHFPLRKGRVNLKVNSVSYKCKPGSTAYDLLLSNASGAKYVRTKDTSFGKQITAINGAEQSNGKYWLYSVGGKEATVGAQLYNCQSEEEIKWELR